MPESRSFDELNATLSNLLQQERYEEALPVAREALVSARQHHCQDPLTIALAMSNLGFVHNQLAEFDLGEHFLRRAMAIRKEQAGENSELYAISLFSLGLCFKAARDPRDALALFEQALTVFTNQLGEIHPHTNRCRAERDILRSLVSRLKPGERVNIATAKQAEVQFKQRFRGREFGKPISKETASPEEWERVCDISEEKVKPFSVGWTGNADPTQQEHFLAVEDQRNQAFELGQRAVALHRDGKLDEALTLYQAQEAICQQHQLYDALSTNLCNQGLLLIGKNLTTEAATILEQSVKLCREHGLASLALPLISLANLRYAAADYPKALEFYREAKAFCEKSGQKQYLHQALLGEGNVRHLDGDFSGALELYGAAGAVCRESNDPQGLANALINQALVLAKSNRQEDASSKAQEAQHLATQHGLTASATQIQSILDWLAANPKSR